ncbi:MAG: hypothetical protein JJ958_06810 [Balneola sp.]|nr:hypothetical protein [Balneola sp.]
MAKQILNKGTHPNDGTGDTLREMYGKVNDNFTELYDKDDDLQSQVDDLEASQNAGSIGYETKALMDADTAQADGTIAQVMNDVTASNNGYYRWNDSGSAWVKRADFYATVLDPDDTSEGVTGKAVDTHNKERKILGTLENEWYDPDFLQQYHNIITLANADSTKLDLVFDCRDNVHAVSSIHDGFNCLKVSVVSGTGVELLHPYLSTSFLSNIGWENGDQFRYGFWIKSNKADGANTRRIYLANGQVVTLASDDWTWVELESGTTYSDAGDWALAYIGLRDSVNPETYYIRGLTITNITQGTWTGERKSSKAEVAKNTPIVNYNAFAENIYGDGTLDSGSLLFEEVTDQNGNPFTKEVVDGDIDILKLTGTLDTQLRSNIVMGGRWTGSGADPYKDYYGLPLKEGYVSIGFWLRTTNVSNFVRIYWFSINSSENFIRYYDPNGEWVWVQSPVVYWGGTSQLSSVLQLQSDPTAGNAVIYEIKGICYSHLEEPLEFKSSYNLEAKKSDWYGRSWTSYGDSITGYNHFQSIINSLLGAKHNKRHCGGSRMQNNNTIFFVNDEGFYIDRPDGSEIKTLLNGAVSSGATSVVVDSSASFSVAATVAFLDGDSLIGSNTIASISGTTITLDVPLTSDLNDNATMYLVPSGATKAVYQGLCTLNRIQNTIPADTELLTIMGGANDFAGYASLGTPLGTIDDAPSDAINATYYASWKAFFENLYTHLGDIKVIVMNFPFATGEDTNENLSSRTREDFRIATREVAQLYGAQIIETDDVGVNTLNWSLYSPDGIHPNNLFGDRIAKKFLKELNLRAEHYRPF